MVNASNAKSKEVSEVIIVNTLMSYERASRILASQIECKRDGIPDETFFCTISKSNQKIFDNMEVLIKKCVALKSNLEKLSDNTLKEKIFPTISKILESFSQLKKLMSIMIGNPEKSATLTCNAIIYQKIFDN